MVLPNYFINSLLLERITPRTPAFKLSAKRSPDDADLASHATLSRFLHCDQPHHLVQGCPRQPHAL